MKLCTFTHDGRARIGIVNAVDGGDVLDITAGMSGLPMEMRAFIEAGPEALGAAADLARRAPRLALADVKLEAPIARPGKILGLGKNYKDHAMEMGGELPDKQMWFAKMPTAITGPHDDIILPKVSDFVDYEAELVVVIGARARHVAAADAHSIIFGYCVGNDVSARDWQRRTSQFVLGKSFDSHAPIGPWITTRDDVPDPQALGVSCAINGETRQDGNTSQMVFSIAEQIAELSSVMTLEPGDLIFTGTPSGVGAGMTPPSALSDGDVARCAISGLGEIANTCRNEA